MIKKLKKEMMESTGKILKILVDREQSKWPHCVGVLHQPKRPRER